MWLRNKRYTNVAYTSYWNVYFVKYTLMWLNFMPLNCGFFNHITVYYLVHSTVDARNITVAFLTGLIHTSVVIFSTLVCLYVIHYCGLLYIALYITVAVQTVLIHSTVAAVTTILCTFYTTLWPIVYSIATLL